MTKYEITVTAVGEMVAEFAADGVLIFFGSTAPEELHDFSVLTTDGSLHEKVERGDVLEIDGTGFPVTAVGEVANQNIAQLGHLVVKFNGLAEAELPGDVSVAPGETPALKVGTSVRIRSEET